MLGIVHGSVLALMSVPSAAGASPDGHEDMVPVAEAVSDGDRPAHHGRASVFVNFDGANLSSSSTDDARSDTSRIVSGAFPPYGGDPSARAATLQAVVADFAPFNVTVTDARPAGGDYTMAMIGPHSMGAQYPGIAPLDCRGASNPNHVVFAFFSGTDSWGAVTESGTLSQEIAHAYGLEHVESGADIMNPVIAHSDRSFLDQCLGLVPASNGIICGEQHVEHCGSGSQNSHQELLTVLGPNVPDAAPPSVTIDYPLDGDAFQTGSSFTIAASASDDSGIANLTLFSDGAQSGTDADEPWGWEVAGIPAGTYAFHVIAVDLVGNETMSNVVTITVSDDAPPPPDTGGGTGSGTGGDDGGTGGGDGGPPTWPPGGPLHEEQDGCGCATTPPAPLAMLTVWLVVPWRRRPGA